MGERGGRAGRGGRGRDDVSGDRWGRQRSRSGTYRRRASKDSGSGSGHLFSCLWAGRGEREPGTAGEDILEGVLELVDVVGAEGDGERRGEVDRERVDH